MTQPTFAIAVTFEIKHDCVEMFRHRVLRQAQDSVEKEPGCVQFDVLQDELNDSVFHLYETYVNAEAFVQHKQTSHFADFDGTVAPWIATKQVRRLIMLQENKK
jgi:autoinducer 2-degrading protein